MKRDRSVHEIWYWQVRHVPIVHAAAPLRLSHVLYTGFSKASLFPLNSLFSVHASAPLCDDRPYKCFYELGFQWVYWLLCFTIRWIVVTFRLGRWPVSALFLKRDWHRSWVPHQVIWKSVLPVLSRMQRLLILASSHCIPSSPMSISRLFSCPARRLPSAVNLFTRSQAPCVQLKRFYQLVVVSLTGRSFCPRIPSDIDRTLAIHRCLGNTSQKTYITHSRSSFHILETDRQFADCNKPRLTIF